MQVSGILRLARKRLDDAIGKDTLKLWQNWELMEYANDGEREIARKLLLLEARDIIGYLTLSGKAGQVDSVSVSGVVITSGVVAYTTSIANTARLLAANITAYASTPNYRASARGNIVVIKAVPQTGYPAGGYTLSAAASGGITAAATDLPGLCRYVVAIGQRYLDMHEKVVDITRFKPAGQSRPIANTTKELLDTYNPGWEEEDNGTISTYAPDYEDHEVILSAPPDAAELIEQDCRRLPLVNMTEDDPDAYPEIGEKYHIALIDWMMKQAFLKDDQETYSLTRSQAAEAEFNKRIEGWRIENIRRMPGDLTNRIPGGLL